MIGFYTIRKLLDAFQPMLPVKKETLFCLTAFPSLKKRILTLGWPEVDEYFDVAKPTTVERKLSFICNQMVHSYLFTPWFDTNGRLAGVFFSSDTQKDRELLRMDLESIITLFEQIATRRGRSPLKFSPEKNRFVM